MSHPFKHLKVILTHRHQVIKNGFHLGIFFLTLRHDLSKFSYQEFSLSSKYYLGNSSPTNLERKSHGGFSEVANHHVHKNKHHFQYWVDFYRGYLIVRPMPLKYALEFFADMLSANKTYDKAHFSGENVLKYFESRKGYFILHSGTKEFLENCIKRYIDSKWKHLHKKQTKVLYEEILKKYPKTEIFKIDNEILSEDVLYG